MAELELEGLHADGEHLVLVGPDGTRYRLRVDDALRAAVRRDRPRLEQVRMAEHARPRDIQASIRAGASAEDVAHAAGLTVEKVRRYEGPVLAEREYVAEQAQSVPIGRESGAPRLGDLVVDRLAARGVSPEDLEWTAVKRPGEGWELVLRFAAGGRDREARWAVDLAARTVSAVDDEGRWLSETELGPAPARRHLSPVRARVYDVELDEPALAAAAIEVGPEPEPAEDDASEPVAAADPASATADLLDELSATRGVRQELPRLEDEEVEGDWDEPPAAHPPASAPQEATDAAVLPLRSASKPEPGPVAPAGDDDVLVDVPVAPEPARKPRSRSRRTSVPSWDEIVFGAKPE